MNEIFKRITYVDSYVLGWALVGDTLKLYLELQLNRDHALFREFSRHEYGCYRLAIMTFGGVENLNRKLGVRLPKVDEHCEEYEDVCGIDDEIEIEENFFSIGDDPRFRISFNYSSVDIEFVDDFDASERSGGLRSDSKMTGRNEG